MPRPRRKAAAPAATRAREPTPQEPEEEEEEEEVNEVEEDNAEDADDAMDEDAEEEEGRSHGFPKLRFNETLTWRAGKPIPLGDLLRRLQKLAKELEHTDQEENDRDAITSVAQELATTNLMSHKDKGVRAWTACCLVDVLRCTAPDAPFASSQLKEIFTMFITSIIPALGDPAHPYNTQHIYVTKSLSEVKSIVLLVELPSSMKLTHMLFQTSFDILSNQQVEPSKVVEYNLTGMLTALVDETESLHADIVEIILAQFLRTDPRFLQNLSTTDKKAGSKPDAHQTTIRLKQLPASYNMARNMCNASADKMARYSSQYFGNVVIDASAASKNAALRNKPRGKAARESLDLENEEDQGPSEEDLKELEKAHRLLRELWRSCPAVIRNVIPQVEAELAAENEHVRLLATQVVGDMAAGIGAAGPPAPPALDPTLYPASRLSDTTQEEPTSWDPTIPAAPQAFSKTYATAYQSFLTRRNDKSPQIRAAWTTCIGRILTSNGGGLGLDQEQELDLTRSLSSMLLDGDDRVRLAAIEAVSTFDLKGIVFKLGALGGVADTGSLLCNLADRVKDRKPTVRSEAMQLMGRIWGVSVGEISNDNEQVKSLLGLIPSKILDAIYINDASINALVDEVMYESLLPLSFPTFVKKKDNTSNSGSQQAQSNGGPETQDAQADSLRAERILLLLRDLDPRSQKALYSVLARPSNYGQYVERLLKLLDEYNGGVGHDRSSSTTDHLRRMIEFFSKLFPNPDHAVHDLWKFAKLNERRMYSLLKFCVSPESDYKKIYRSMKEMNRKLEGNNPHQGGNLASFMWLFTYRVSNLYYNKSHVPAILRYAQTNNLSLAGAAHDILKEISTRTPSIFKAHAEELCTSLENNAPSATRPNDPSAIDQLKACATFARNYPDDVPKERRFFKAMAAYALHGSPPTVAKHAVTIILSSTEKKDMHARDLLKQCMDGFEYGSKDFLAKLACLSQLMLMYAKELEDETDTVVDIAIKQVLTEYRHGLDNDPNDEDFKDECTAKIWSLRILANRVRCYDDSKAVAELARPVYQFLNTAVANYGEVSRSGDQKTPETHRNRLRLESAVLLLKLSAKKNFDPFVTPRAFNSLATCAQDPSPSVRHAFVSKVKKYLGQDRLSSRFYTIPFLFEFEPDPRPREETLTWLRTRALTFQRADKHTFEHVFPRFLSLLAHHPDFGIDKDDLVDAVRYITFYLSAVATEINLPLIYHLAQRLKGSTDTLNPAESERLYVLSDLAQVVIRTYEEVKGWSMQTHPSKMPLPKELFTTLNSHEQAQRIAETSYLPDDLDDAIEPLVRKAAAGSRKAAQSRKRKSEADSNALSASRKRTHPSDEPSKLPSRKKASGRAAASSRRSRQVNSSSAEPDEYEGAAELPSSATRKSARASKAERKSYAETSDLDDVAEGDSDEN